VPHDVPKRRVTGGRVAGPPDRRSKPGYRFRRPATRGQRIWLWMSLFPAGFYLAFMVLFLASSVGLLAAIGINVGIGLVMAVVNRLIRRRGVDR
jgi:hypothetical protein